MKKNATKRALLFSVLALVLCMSMFVGTTYAWFTDSVTSSNNKIVAGTLDVQLWMHNGTEYVDISDSDKPIFGEGSIAQNNNAETLWEPGKTQVAYLAIKNEGNLALKYTVGLNVQNVSKDLYEVMQYAITPNAQASAPLTAWAGNGNDVVVGTQAVTDGDTVMNPGDTHYFALSIRMDETAGNEYQGGEVNFDLTVLATQATVESDSFNDQYDVNAKNPAIVRDAAALTAALAEGGDIILGADITLDSSINLSNADFVLNGNGHTVTMADGATNTYALLDITRGNATIKNIRFDGIKEGAVVRTAHAEFNADNVTVENCEITQINGLFRLLGKSTVTNCTFRNNTCNMVISLNWDGANEDPQVVKNCVFEGNTCNKTAVVYYVKGAGATIDGNKFLNNTVNSDNNAATLYMGFTENNVITNNVFDGNHVSTTDETYRVTGGLMIGYEAVITGNAFINNTVEGENAKGNDVCVSPYYCDIDLSGNYWGGSAPVAGDDYYQEYDNYSVIINDYLTAYGN